MRLILKFLLVPCCFIFICITSSFSQDIVINNIVLAGHKITADPVIYRELDIQPGDTLQLTSLSDDLSRNKKRLLSTGLFNIVDVNIKNWDTESNLLDVHFQLKENWYIYPSIIWEYADRSFNVWWKDFRFNFKRTNYGLRVDHLNLTGHKDRLKLKFQRGFTQKYEALYTYPYFIGNWGLGGSLFFSENKEMGYKTEQNRPLFLRTEDERILLTRLRAGLSLYNRTNAYAFHTFRIQLHNNNIDEVVYKELNPDYFLNGASGIKFMYGEYDFQYDRRVFPTYPEGGYLLFFNLKKEGFGIFNEYDNLSVFGGFEKHIPISKNLIFGNRVKLKYNLIRDQVGYANNTGLGYGDYVRGYELYVVDGTDFFLSKTDLKWRIFQKIFDIKEYMFISQFDELPISIWLRGSFDIGYVNEPTYKETNFLANNWMWGGGPGMDIMIYNNYKISFEYNFNRLGEGGLFLGGGFSF